MQKWIININLRASLGADSHTKEGGFVFSVPKSSRAHKMISTNAASVNEPSTPHEGVFRWHLASNAAFDRCVLSSSPPNQLMIHPSGGYPFVLELHYFHPCRTELNRSPSAGGWLVVRWSPVSREIIVPANVKHFLAITPRRVLTVWKCGNW